MIDARKLDHRFSVLGGKYVRLRSFGKIIEGLVEDRCNLSIVIRFHTLVGRRRADFIERKPICLAVAELLYEDACDGNAYGFKTPLQQFVKHFFCLTVRFLINKLKERGNCKAPRPRKIDDFESVCRGRGATRTPPPRTYSRE